MPKNVKRNKVSRPSRSNGLQYAEPKLEQKYAKVSKELGCRKFLCELLNGQERIASLSSGTARRASSNGIRRLKADHWVLIQPLTSDVDGPQEIVTVYNTKEHKQLEQEGRLAIVKEEKEEEQAVVFEGDEDKPDEIVIDDDDIDIDDL